MGGLLFAPRYLDVFHEDNQAGRAKDIDPGIYCCKYSIRRRMANGLFPIGPPGASSERSDVNDERAGARSTAASETDGCQFGNIVLRWFSARGIRSTACNSLSHYFIVNISQFLL